MNKKYSYNYFKKGRAEKLVKKLSIIIGLFFVMQISLGSLLLTAALPYKAQAESRIANPSLDRSCGIDIVLIVDSSSSMYGQPLQQEKEAFKTFINAFLPKTPTEIAIVNFNTIASIVQNFSNDAGVLSVAIDGISTSPNPDHPDYTGLSIKYTNWEDALAKAHSLFSSGRPDKSKLYVFASDGNPNRTGPSGTTDTQTNAVYKAAGQADQIKNDGVRIISLGIGETVISANLQTVSGPVVAPPAPIDKDADVIMTGFHDLAANLAALADELCSGTVTIRKFVNNSPAAGWDFSLSATNSDPAQSVDTTDQNGFITFNLDIPNDKADLIITESPQTNRWLERVECEIDDTAVPIARNGYEISGLQMDNSDNVYCAFYNQIATGTITITKKTSPDTAFEFGFEGDLGDFNLNGSVQPATSSRQFDNLLAGEYTITENQIDNWKLASIVCQGDNNQNSTVSIASSSVHLFLDGGENIYCEFTNNEISPTISGSKYKDIDGLASTTADQSPFAGWLINLYSASATTTPVATTTTGSDGYYFFDHLDFGEYIVGEENREHWTALSTTAIAVTINADKPLSENNNFINHPESYCGDSIKDETEQCDNGAANGSCPAACSLSCQTNQCGGPGPGPYCGDNSCNNNETCSNCAQDCGSCGGPVPLCIFSGTCNQTASTPETPIVLGESGQPILQISKTINKKVVNPGDNGVEYTIAVKNIGNLAAYAVEVKDVLPVGLLHADDNGGNMVWKLGDLASGAEKIINYKVNVASDVKAGDYKNIATAQATNHGPVSAAAILVVEEVEVLAATGFNYTELISLFVLFMILWSSPVFLRQQTVKISD